MKPSRPLVEYPDTEPADVPPPPPPGLPGEPAAIPAGSSRAAPRPAPEAAALRFLDAEARSASIPLEHPFLWQEREVRAIDVRRLTVAEVGAVVESAGGMGEVDLYDFYAAMTGLPAPVLRGLDDDDGASFVAAARPFLPRLVREAL